MVDLRTGKATLLLSGTGDVQVATGHDGAFYLQLPKGLVRVVGSNAVPVGVEGLFVPPRRPEPSYSEC